MWLALVCGAWALAEAAFVAIYWRKARKINALCGGPSPHDPAPLIDAFIR
jgi:hypothetical protein